MKHSIIKSGIETSSRLYSDTMNKATNKNDKVENKATQVYKWTIETELGNFSGTCLCIDDINDEIALLTNNTRIIKKNITPVTIINDRLGDKVYTWNVVTHSGQASGISLSLEEAKRVINSFGTAEIVESNIVESSTHEK